MEKPPALCIASLYYHAQDSCFFGPAFHQCKSVLLSAFISGKVFGCGFVAP